MITLYQFESCLGVPNPSPFCLKLETYLRMAGLPYRVVTDANVRKAPKRKFPYIQDGDRTLADSAFIIDYLKQTYGDPLDQPLSLRERATAVAFQRLMEDNLYWSILYSRWVEDDNWPQTRQAYFAGLPPVVRFIVPELVRRTVVRNLDGHGMGRHTRDEIYAIGQRDILAIGDFLSDKPFLMGEQPTSLDATGYGFLVNLLKAQIASPLADYALQFENLNAYCDRMTARYWNE